MQRSKLLGNWLHQPDNVSWVARWILHCALLSLVCYSGWQAAESLGAKPVEPRSFAVFSLGQDSGHQDTALVQRLTDKHMFGLAAPPAATAAPVIALSAVRVIGILSSYSPQNGWAILDMDGGQHSYQAGSTLPDGETLVEVHDDRVILAKGGSRYSVLWDMAYASLSVSVPTLNLGAAGLWGPAVEEQDSRTPTAAASVPTTLQSLHDLRQQLLNKPRLSLPPVRAVGARPPAHNSSDP